VQKHSSDKQQSLLSERNIFSYLRERYEKTKVSERISESDKYKRCDKKQKVQLVKKLR